VPFAALAGNDPARRPAQLRRALAVVAAVEDARGREVLARATVELAAIRLCAATISTTWKESPMPIPSVLSKLYDEGLEEGLEKGREEGREKGLIEAVASLLRIRFGDDPRADAVASRLVPLGATEAMAAVERAGSLDELS
jgi:flagellar biosynthesis/type III secretory pathway protein FliH